LDFAELVKRCELLVHLAEASFWLMDVPALRRFVSEAELLADGIGRDDLWADARAWRASAQVAEGDVLGGIETDRRTLARVGGIRSFGLARVPLTLYWAGHTTEAAARAAEAVESARASGEAAFLLYALQHLGISLTGAGRYDEAIAAFDEACSLGRQCGASSLLARAISMSVAPLFSLGDFAGAANRAREARELAHRVAFEPPLVSAGIDLLMILARTHDPGRAEPLLVEVEQAVAQASGWHAWKWKMRLSQARVELALARGEWRKAIPLADDVIEQSKRRNRPKYQVLGLMARARARRELGVRKAVEDARASVDVARRLSDPVLLAECLGVLLSQDGTDELSAESRRAVERVLLGVTDQALRRSFLSRVTANGERQKS
jgi:tetratricopeptide (TPR) repeat protein